MKRLAILGAVIGVGFLVSCGGGDGPLEPTATEVVVASGTSTTAATPQPTRSVAPVIGQVEDADGDARVNGERANQNLKLHTADRIETKASSSIDFTLTGPQVECKTLANSQLEVRPDTSTVIKWLSRTGVSYCSVERGQPPVEARFGLDPDVQLTVEGTIFGISQSTLRVVEGFVTFRAGRTTQRLGPNELATFSPTGQFEGRSTWDGLAGDEAALVGDLQTRRPAIALTPTATERGQSTVINAWAGQRAPVILLDDRASGQDEDFVLAYFQRLGEAWFDNGTVRIQRYNVAQTFFLPPPAAVGVSVTRGPSSQPTPTGSASPKATPTPTSTAVVSTVARDSVPFYVDQEGTTWNVTFILDSNAKSAFARFTKGILTNGDYYDLYSAAFIEGAPPYDRLLQLLQ